MRISPPIPQTGYGIKVVVGGQLDVTCDRFTEGSDCGYLLFYSSGVLYFVSLQDLTCLFEIYLKPLQNETFLTQDEVGVGAPETR